MRIVFQTHIFAPTSDAQVFLVAPSGDEHWTPLILTFKDQYIIKLYSRFQRDN